MENFFPLVLIVWLFWWIKRRNLKISVSLKNKFEM